MPSMSAGPESVSGALVQARSKVIIRTSTHNVSTVGLVG
jgi:hypothetical protein